MVKTPLFQEEVSESTRKIADLERKIEADAASIDQLKQEVLEGKKLADAAHTREQKAQEVIENLRVSVAKLTDELDQKSKQLALEDP